MNRNSIDWRRISGRCHRNACSRVFWEEIRRHCRLSLAMLSSLCLSISKVQPKRSFTNEITPNSCSPTNFSTANRAKRNCRMFQHRHRNTFSRPNLRFSARPNTFKFVCRKELWSVQSKTNDGSFTPPLNCRSVLFQRVTSTSMRKVDGRGRDRVSPRVLLQLN